MEIEKRDLFTIKIDKLIDQPLDGLLYDLDLLPECAKNGADIIRSLVITRMKERLDKLSE